MHHAKSDELLAGTALARFEGKVDLIFTSPPFPLNRKKRFGNEKGEEYVRWLCAFGPLFKKMLKHFQRSSLPIFSACSHTNQALTGRERYKTFQ